jgi:hypothetical protein
MIIYNDLWCRPHTPNPYLWQCLLQDNRIQKPFIIKMFTEALNKRQAGKTMVLGAFLFQAVGRRQ